MGGILQAVNDLFAGVMPISDFLWDVPTNFNWYSSIPILGQYSLGIIFLLGIGIYFTIRLKGVQFKEFKESIRMLTHSKKEAKVGTTPLQAFLMSMGGRVGAGNIVGVTGFPSAGPARSSGCGCLLFSVCLLLLLKVRWHRSIRNAKETSMLAALRSIRRNCGEIRFGLVLQCACFI